MELPACMKSDDVVDDDSDDTSEQEAHPRHSTKRKKPISKGHYNRKSHVSTKKRPSVIFRKPSSSSAPFMHIVHQYKPVKFTSQRQFDDTLISELNSKDRSKPFHIDYKVGNK